MRLYIDTGVLVKLYYPEQESEVLESWLRANPVQILFAPLHRLEMTNAMALKVHRGEASEDAFDAFLQLIQEDLASRVLVAVQPDSSQVLSEATVLSRRYSLTLGTRSLDVLHVAAARVLECTSLLSNDKRQLALAQAMGMRAIALESLS